MNRTWIVFLFGCLFQVSWFATPGKAQDLIEREGRYIRLMTDLPTAEEADSLVASFDAAAPQWFRFWGLNDADFTDWKVNAYVIRNKDLFRSQGLIPADIPDFPFGYAQGLQIWVLAQQSEYYTRHLLLHEGVHSLAFHHFGGAGPTWFMEGTAELLATHSGQAAATKINQIPSSREAVPHWGRFALMKQLRAKQSIPAYEQVLRFQPNLLGDVETYGWSWAATLLLDVYPEYHDAFQAAARNGRDRSNRFNQQLYRTLSQQWPAIVGRWQLMCHELDYGFDRERERVAISTKDKAWDEQQLEISVAADRGWQSIGVRLVSGTKLTIEPSGQVSLAETEKPWISEPAGVTIRYHKGRPLGQLLMCVLPHKVTSQRLPKLDVRPVTQPTTYVVEKNCWLLFRVNDAVSELADNRGEFSVSLKSE